jgi:hypothetical protein
MSQAVLPVPNSEQISPAFEDFAVTLQVVLVGTDGLVLASDRLIDEQRSLPRFGTHYHDRHHQQDFGSKVFVGDHIACSFAGGPDAERIARVIFESANPRGCSDTAWRTQIEGIVRTVHSSDFGVIDEVIILRGDNCRSALKLMRQGSLDPSFTQINCHRLAGDVVRQANFLPTHLWRDTMSIRDLVLLSLLTIAYASKENPAGIGGGADVLTLAGDAKFSVRSYSQSELDKMRQDFDKSLSKVLIDCMKRDRNAS